MEVELGLCFPSILEHFTLMLAGIAAVCEPQDILMWLCQIHAAVCMDHGFVLSWKVNPFSDLVLV